MMHHIGRSISLVTNFSGFSQFHWTSLIEYNFLQSSISDTQNLFRSKENFIPKGIEVESQGARDITEELKQALKYQWIHGFPNVPAGLTSLTHGTHSYPASMQAATAKHLINSLLPGDSLADPFVGGGTVLIEGLRAGRTVYGGDISPLALFVSSGRLWLPSEEKLNQFEELLINLIDGISLRSEESTLKNWETVKNAITEVSLKKEEFAFPLWFIYSAALEQGKKARHAKKQQFIQAEFYKNLGLKYITGVKELQKEMPYKEYKDQNRFLVHLQQCDACKFKTPQKVSSILTSPPYPGVYDYLSHARNVKSKFGSVNTKSEIHPFVNNNVPGDRSWPSNWLNNEIGSFKQLKKSPFDFKNVWQISQNKWIKNVCENLSNGGRIAIQIGDGAGINGLESTIESMNATSQCISFDGKMTLLGHVTFRSSKASYARSRTEHILLYERL